MRFQRIGAFLAAAAMVLPAVAQGESQQFDLPGPALRMSVTRGGATLPIAKVPSIAEGDRIRIAAELPESQGVRYLLVAAFLRGATNPPPKRWFFKAESWERKKGSLDLEVPKGAEQLVLFVVPETGGGFDAVVDTVRRQPGAFVRASIELAQASRDRARLDLFLDGIQDAERNRPAEIPARTEQLTRALSIKVRDECLQQPVEQRAACMGQSENTLLLTDGTRTSLAETLVGAPTDLALQIAATPEGGYGYYSPYIGVVRDVARLFGAFQTTRFTYIPALAQLEGERAGLLLNTAPSFSSPKSVMVVGLPPVRPVDPPLLRAGADQVLCAPPGELVLPVTGAPLVYATDYAHGMALRVKGPNGATVDLPARADALRGGYVVAAHLLAGQKGPVEAQLHGNWGFAPLDGPSFRLQAPRGGWRIAGEGAGVVVGRDNALTLEGGTAACVSRVSLRDASGAVQEVAWKAAGDGSIAATLPLAKAKPGKMTLLVEQQGVAQPESIAIAALAEASRIDRLRFHAGDAEATLYGARLEKVTRLTIGDAVFEPADLGREGKADRLVLRASAPVAVPAAGQPFQAKAVLADGRSLSIDGTVEAQRPMAAVVSRTVARGGGASEGMAIRIEGDTVLPNDARLTFALKAQGSTRFTGTERVEVASEDGRATAAISVKLQDATIAIASLAPAEALGGSAYGPLRYRVVQGESAGPWAPLGTLVRLPQIAAVACADGQDRCTLTGSDLFLLDAVAGDPGFAQPVRVPEGFTGTSLAVPKATPLYLRLRDDRTAVASVGK